MENVFGPSEGPFSIDHPVVMEERSQEGAEGLLLGQGAEASGKGELSVPKGALQAGNELAAKHPAEDFHREEESIVGPDPV
jgi:hypothetical protein